MKPRHEVIRRRADGSIDTGFYLARAHDERCADRRALLLRLAAAPGKLARRLRVA